MRHFLIFKKIKLDENFANEEHACLPKLSCADDFRHRPITIGIRIIRYMVPVRLSITGTDAMATCKSKTYATVKIEFITHIIVCVGP